MSAKTVGEEGGGCVRFRESELFKNLTSLALVYRVCIKWFLLSCFYL